MVRFMVSQAGPHTADEWAMVTAEEIFNIDPSVNDTRLIDAKQTQINFANLLASYFDIIIDSERCALEADPEYCSKHYRFDLAQSAVNQLVSLANDTPWAGKLNSSDWIEHATAAITQHMITAQHVERLWHADNNPNNQAAADYKAKFQGSN